MVQLVRPWPDRFLWKQPSSKRVKMQLFLLRVPQCTCRSRPVNRSWKPYRRELSIERESMDQTVNWTGNDRTLLHKHLSNSDIALIKPVWCDGVALHQQNPQWVTRQKTSINPSLVLRTTLRMCSNRCCRSSTTLRGYMQARFTYYTYHISYIYQCVVVAR